MHSTSLLLFVVPFAIGAAFPGPVQTALVARVVARGTPGTSTFVAGIVTGNACWLTVAAMGLSALAVQHLRLFLFVKWAGVAYLAWLGWKLWHAPTDAPTAGCC